MSQPHIPHAPHTPKLGAASTAIVAIVTANPGISTQQIHAEMRLHHPRITYSLSRPNSLAQHRHIVNMGRSGSGMARWYAASMVPRQPKPVADPHHAAPPNPLAYLAMPTKRTAPDLSPWLPERHEAARPEGKRAFELPSRDGDKFAPYTGPKPMCVGPGQGIYGPSRAGHGARGGVER